MFPPVDTWSAGNVCIEHRHHLQPPECFSSDSPAGTGPICPPARARDATTTVDAPSSGPRATDGSLPGRPRPVDVPCPPDAPALYAPHALSRFIAPMPHGQKGVSFDGANSVPPRPDDASHTGHRVGGAPWRSVAPPRAVYRTHPHARLRLGRPVHPAAAVAPCMRTDANHGDGLRRQPPPNCWRDCSGSDICGGPGGATQPRSGAWTPSRSRRSPYRSGLEY